MEARSAMSWYCGSLLAAAIALFLSVSLGVHAASVGAAKGGAGAGAAGAVSIKASCATTPDPALCLKALSEDHSIKADAASPRDVASAALRAAAAAGGEAGDFARREMDVAKDNGVWQCLNECAEDIEEALDHLDDTDGVLDDGKLRDVKLFLDTAEKDTWSCDEACKDAPPTPAKDLLLAKNRYFEDLMRVAHVLVKQATGGGDAAPTP